MCWIKDAIKELERYRQGGFSGFWTRFRFVVTIQLWLFPQCCFAILSNLIISNFAIDKQRALAYHGTGG